MRGVVVVVVIVVVVVFRMVVAVRLSYVRHVTLVMRVKNNGESSYYMTS